jgi:phosphoribosylaminoimidazole-succinocarboxamide synthase
MRKPSRTGSLSDKWWEMINYFEWFHEAPIVAKSQGKTSRVELPVLESSALLAQQIRENFPALFRTTIEVHRAADYLGLIILKQALELQKDRVIHNDIITLAEDQEKDRRIMSIISQLKESWDMLGQKYEIGLISEDTLMKEALSKVELVTSPDKVILKVMCEIYILNEILSPDSSRRWKAKVRKRNQRDRDRDLITGDMTNGDIENDTKH